MSRENLYHDPGEDPDHDCHHNHLQPPTAEAVAMHFVEDIGAYLAENNVNCEEWMDGVNDDGSCTLSFTGPECAEYALTISLGKP